MSEIITIGETSYTIIYPDLVRPLTVQERQDLRDSIGKYGIKYPVILDENGNIIDGANRTRIAAELGLPVIPTRIVECESEEEKRDLALRLNVDRRHLSPEERKAVTEARRQRVQEARAAGKSLRTIASEEGVSESQVRKDISSSPAHQCAPENSLEPSTDNTSQTGDSLSRSPDETGVPTPVVIVGRDGKRYSSQKQNKRTPRNKPKKCNIKGLVKSVKVLVEREKVKEWTARTFAEKFDVAGQKQFLDGKDDDAICMALAVWRDEQDWIREAERFLAPRHGLHGFDKWDASKVSTECRREVIVHLARARDYLDKIIVDAERVASPQEPATE